MRKSFGAQGRNRTTDTVIFSHVLYQLSYLGAGLAFARPWESAGVIVARPGTVQNGRVGTAVLILAKQSQWSAPSSLPRKRESIVPQALASAGSGHDDL